VIDEHPDVFEGHAEPAARSRMNVTFRLARADDEAAFLAGAAEDGMVELRGHRSVGGIRASIYNAMPVDGVERLAAFMRRFAER
jgi:phosphoserine aminotransferase